LFFLNDKTLKQLTLFVTKLMQEIGYNHVCVDYLFQKSVI